MEGGERSVVSHQDERTADRACSAEGDLTEVEGVQPDPLEPGHEPAPIPHFRLPPTDPAIRPLGEAKPDLTQASRALRETFTPTRPKKHRNRAFAGRYRIMERVIAAVEEDRAHVVIFGDRFEKSHFPENCVVGSIISPRNGTNLYDAPVRQEQIWFGTQPDHARWSPPLRGLGDRKVRRRPSAPVTTIAPTCR